MAEEAKKTNTGLIAGIIGGVVVAIAAIIVVLIIVLSGKGLGGTYKLYSETANGETHTVEEMKSENAGIDFESNYKLVLNDDGTGKMTMNGETQDITWDKDKKTITADGQTVNFTTDGGKITIEIAENVKMTFEK